MISMQDALTKGKKEEKKLTILSSALGVQLQT